MTQAANPQSVRIVFLAAIGWDSLLAGRTRHLAHAVAQAGNPVSFVELPSLRRLLRRKSTDTDGMIDVIRLPPNPMLGRRIAGWASAWQAYAAHRLNHRWKKPTALVVTTPWWARVLPRLKADLICYDCNDHFSIHAGRTRLSTFAIWHKSLLSASNLVVAVSKPLQDELSRESHGKPVYLLPNAADASWFGSPLPAMPRERMRCTPNRRIAGFIGALFGWVDLDLIGRCAAALPQIDFVLVGPLHRGITLGDLLGRPNIHYCGPVPPGEVPAWIAAFDVCLLPFKRGRISETADPIKLYEYCALGKPAVATHDSGCHVGAKPWTTAASDAEFIAAIPRAIAEDSPCVIRNRIEFAKANTWQVRARRLLDLIETRRATS
jgi:glycosyltransferase involved in cell wall biosynthesis